MNELAILPVLIALNAFFAASEMALVSVNKTKIASMAEEGHRKARRLAALLAEPGSFLATIQIGITLAGFLASAFAAEGLAGGLAEQLKKLDLAVPDAWLLNAAVIIITIILAYFALVLGELAPKRLAMKKAETVALFVAGPLELLAAAAAPFVRLLTLSANLIVSLFGMNPLEEDEEITEEEIRMMVDAGRQKGAIEPLEQQMIDSILEFNDKTAADIMTHRTEIVAFPVETSLEEVVNSIHTQKYSRIPVFEGNLDNIIGVLYAKDIIKTIATREAGQEYDLKTMCRQPYFVPASKKTDELLKEIKRNKIHIAIVIDEYGGTAGLVTLEDLLEEIVGEIYDEYDEEEVLVQLLDENTFIIHGSASLETVNASLGIRLPEGEYDTLSGFIIGQLGKIPRQDDREPVEFNGFVFIAEQVAAHRITRVRAYHKQQRDSL